MADKIIEEIIHRKHKSVEDMNFLKLFNDLKRKEITGVCFEKYTCRTLIIFLFSILFNAQVNAYNLAGIRGVQIRSNKIVTIWLGYNSTTDSVLLYDLSKYSIESPNDPNYKNAIHPIRISRFMKGSRDANGKYDRRPLSDKFMHLEMKHPFKKGKIYFIKVESGLLPPNYPQTIQFSLDLTPNPGFKLNQVGYSNTVTTKLVYFSSYLGDGEPIEIEGDKEFSVINATTGETTLNGNFKWVSDKDPQGNDKLYVLDISSLKEEGYFYINSEGLGRSYTFQNGKSSAKHIYEIMGRGFYFQRCGTDIVEPFAGKWPREMAHNKVYVPKENIVHPWQIEVDPSRPSSGKYYVPEGPREIHGGHYDAGDYDTRLTHMAVPEKLMSLYEALPGRFFDGQIFIPENSNGIPDILDEVAWNLLHLEYLQDYFADVRGEFGPMPPGMESYTHPSYKWATTGEGDLLPYFMRKATPYTSFCGAAIFAQAARVFAPFDKEKSKKYMQRSIAAYDYAVRHKEEKYNPKNQHVLSHDWEEKYDDKKLSTAWCWAAGQLFASTGKVQYMNDFIQKNENASHDFRKNKWAAVWPVLITKERNHAQAIINELKNELIAECDTIVQWVVNNGKSGYQSACPNKGDWGSANPIKVTDILSRGYYLTKNQAYLDCIATALDFILGMNPSEISWVTGAGKVYPMDPLNHNAVFDVIEEPTPGIVIFGPGDSWKHKENPLYPDPENMGFYRRISDVYGYVRGCEYVVDCQMVDTYVAAALLLEE